MKTYEQSPKSGGARTGWPAVRLLAVLLLTGVLAGTSAVATAATIPTGPTPVDTVIRPDGSEAFILNQGNSTVTVIDPLTQTPIASISLSQPPNVCTDMDWSEVNQVLYVSTSTGLLLSVNPAVPTVTVQVTNLGANYRNVCADHRLVGTDAWGWDATSNSLHRFPAGGGFVPVLTLTVGVGAELIEERVDANAPTAFDDFLLCAGTTAGSTVVQVFDRFTWAPLPLLTYGVAPRTATGITTSTAGQAYVSAAVPGGGAGDLLLLDFGLGAFRGVPVSTFNTGTPVDVSMAGQWISVLVSLNASAAADVYLFDAGVPGAPLPVGFYTLDATAAPVSGSSMQCGAAGSLDDTVFLAPRSGQDAAGETYMNVRPFLNEASPGNVTAGLWGVPTASALGLPAPGSDLDQTCPPQEVVRRGYIETPTPLAGTMRSVQYSTRGGDLHVPDPERARGGAGPRPHADVPLAAGLRLPLRAGMELNADVRLEPKANGDLDYHNGHGRYDTYVSQGGGVYTPPVHYDTTLVQGGGQRRSRRASGR